MTALDPSARPADEAPRDAAAQSARAGRMACFCPPGAPSPGAVVDQGGWSPGVATLAVGFALSVLSQSLALGMLPLGGPAARARSRG